MPDNDATYRTLRTPVEEIVYKDRKSKFIGYAYPVRSEKEIKVRLEALKNRYTDANHICYAWKIGITNPNYRVQDDGEPRNSAGIPIYGQINSLELTNIVVFVVRYFGGVKLGVGGLISAYKATARNTLDLGDIQKQWISCRYQVTFDYSQMNTVQRLISRLQLEIVERKMEEEATLLIKVPLSKKLRFLDSVNALYNIDLKEVEEN